MKKARNQPGEPSRASLREIPETDFGKAEVRRNPFAARIAAEGIQIKRGRPNKGEEGGPRGSRPPFGQRPSRKKLTSS